MPFEIGHKLSKGRPKGAVNHNTRFIRNALKDIIIDSLPQIKYDLVFILLLTFKRNL